MNYPMNIADFISSGEVMESIEAGVALMVDTHDFDGADALVVYPGDIDSQAIETAGHTLE